MINEIKQEFPQDFLDMPENSFIKYLFGSRDGDDKNFRITLSKLFNDLGFEGVGGTPIFFEGNQLPAVDNNGDPLTRGDWVILTEGEYLNINSGPAVVIDLGNFGFSMFDGTIWGFPKQMALPVSPPVTKEDVAEFAYLKEEYVTQVLVDTAIAPSITVNGVAITDEVAKKELLKKLDQCFKSFKVFGIPDSKFILLRQFSYNPAGNLGIGLVVADNERDDVNLNANNNGFIAVSKDYTKPFTLEFRERYRETTYLATLDMSVFGTDNVNFNFRDSAGIGSYKTCGIKYTSVSNIPKKAIWGTDFNYTNGSTDILPQAFYFHEAVKLLKFSSNSNELVKISGFSWDATNGNIIFVTYSCLDDIDNNIDVVADRNGYSTHRFTVPLSATGVKRYKLTTPSGPSQLKGDLVIDMDYIKSKMPALSTNGLTINKSNNAAQWIITPGGSGGGGIVTSLILVGGGDSFQGNFSFNPTANWAINAAGNMSKLTRIPPGSDSIDFNLSLNGSEFNILYLDKDFQNLGWGYDGSSGVLASLNSVPPAGAVFFLVSTSTAVGTANVTANGSFEINDDIKTYRSLAEGLGDPISGPIFIVKDKYFRKLINGVCSLSEYTSIEGEAVNDVPVLEKDGVKIIPTEVPYSGTGNGTFTGGVLCAIDKGSMYFYNNNARAVYKSNDDGSTFEIITDKFLHPTVWNDRTATVNDQRNSIVVLENGDLLIPVRVSGAIFANTNGVDRYERYWVMYKYSLSSGTMTKLFEFSHEDYVQDWDPLATNYGWDFHASGCMLGDFTFDVYGDTIVITEYGEGTSHYWASQGITNNARGVSARAWVSFDNGTTWKKMFDGDRKITGTGEADNNWFYFTSTSAAKYRHMHGVSIDRVGKRVYLTNGDNEDYLWNVSLLDLQTWYNSAPAVDPNSRPIYATSDTYPVWDSPLIAPSAGNSNYGYSAMRYQMMYNKTAPKDRRIELHDASRSFSYMSHLDDEGNLVFEPVRSFEEPEDFELFSQFVTSWLVTDSFVQQSIRKDGVIYVTFNNGGTRPSRIRATIDGYNWKTVFVGDNSDIKFAGKILFNGDKAYLSDGTFGQASNTSGYWRLQTA